MRVACHLKTASLEPPTSSVPKEMSVELRPREWKRANMPCVSLLGKVIEKAWLQVWPKSWTQGIAGSPFLPCAWNVLSTSLPCTRSGPRTQPWNSNVMMRLCGLGTWLNPVKAPCRYDWPQLRPLYKLLMFDQQMHKMTCGRPRQVSSIPWLIKPATN